MTTTSTAVWPDIALVGYVTAYGSTTPPNVTNQMISDALNHQYNVFPYAFAAIDTNNKVTIPNTDFSTQITDIHNRGGIALLSFGGQNNSFTPNANDPTGAAKNTAAILKQHGFDGIDLDLESLPDSITASYVQTYTNELRKAYPGIIITAAPQIGGGYGGPATLAPNSIFTQDFLNKVKFDALLIQEYNQFGGANFDGKVDTQVGFISASFGPLTKLVPKETKIIIGEPATTQAGSGLTPSEIVADITKGNSNGPLVNQPQFGGAMTWAMNYDAFSKPKPWLFADTVFPAISASSINNKSKSTNHYITRSRSSYSDCGFFALTSKLCNKARTMLNDIDAQLEQAGTTLDNWAEKTMNDADTKLKEAGAAVDDWAEKTITRFTS